MEVVKINVESRDQLGKKASKQIRKDGRIPAVMYSKKNGVTHFTTKHGDVKTMVYTPQFKLAELTLNGNTSKAIIKDIDFHPVTDEIVHMDFLELVDGQPLTAEIPVVFRGVSPGVKSGGKLITTLRKVKVKATPEVLVDTLEVSIDELELGFAVRVKDIEVPEGMQIMVDGAMPVANVIVPRVLKTAEEEEAEAAEAGGDTEAPEAEAEAESK